MKRVIYLCMAGLMLACSGNKQQEQATETAATAEVTMAASIEPFADVPAAVKTQLDGFLVGYFALSNALIDDNLEGAKASAASLATQVGKFDMSALPAGEQMDFYHAQESMVLTSLNNMAAAADIEEFRQEVAPLSEAMYAWVKAFQPRSGELYYQFCPMARDGAGANWLSEAKEISNPYMGQRMLKCGRTQEVIASK